MGNMNITASDLIGASERCMKLKGFLRIAGTDTGIMNIQNLQKIEPNNGAAVAIELAHNLKTTQIVFQDLQDVHGSIWVYDNTALTALRLPRLKSVSDGSIVVTANEYMPGMDVSGQAASQGQTKSTAANVVVDLTSLSRLEGNLSLSNIHQLFLGNLSYIQGDITVIQSDVTDLMFPSLKEINTLSVQSNPRLQRIQFDQLENIMGNMYLESNPAFMGFTALDAPKLQRVHGSVVVENVQSAASVRSLDFGTALQQVDGGMFVRVRLTNQEVLDSGNVTCQGLRQKYKDSGIVKGKFSCTIQDGQGRDVDTTDSSAVILQWRWLGVFAGLLVAFC
jgi:hypothetical protein